MVQARRKKRLRWENKPVGKQIFPCISFHFLKFWVSCTALRKVTAILLTLIFLFNLFGYQFLLSVLEKNANNKLELLIDNNEYDDAELTEIRVRLNMPYQYRYTDFERHYGKITIEGKEYSYVKRKVEGDILVLKCIPDISGTQIKAIAADITKTNSDNTQGGTPVKSSAKIFSFECDGAMHQNMALSRNDVSDIFPDYSEALNTLMLPVLHQPPRLAAA